MLARARVAAYARYSTDRQNAASTEAQVEKVRAYVEARGGELRRERVYVDEAVSGAVRERPGLLALVRAVEARDVDVIVAEDLGRISRDVEDLAWFRKRCAYYGVRLIAIDDGVDTSNEGAELMGDVLGSFKALYRREISSKTTRGMEQRARAGYATGGLPYGYRAERVPYAGGEASEIRIDEEHARIIRDIFAAYAYEGLSYAGIASRLNGRRIPPPRASKPRKREAWGVSTVRTVLHNECYIGRWSFGRRKWQRDPDTRQRVPREREGALVELDRPELAIVDRATWDAVAARLEVTRTLYTGRRRIPAGQRLTHPLSGILRCAHCGSLLTISGGAEGRRYYACTGARRGTCEMRAWLRESTVRERVIGGIRERFSTRDGFALLERMIAEELGADDELDTRRRDLSARLAQAEARIRRLTLAIADGAGGSPATVLRMIAELEEQAREDRATLERLAAAPRVAVEVPTPRDVLDSLAEVLSGPAPTVRAMLGRLLEDGVLQVERESDGNIYAQGGLLPAVLLGRSALSSIAGAGETRESIGIRLVIGYLAAA